MDLSTLNKTYYYYYLGAYRSHAGVFYTFLLSPRQKRSAKGRKKEKKHDWQEEEVLRCFYYNHLHQRHGNSFADPAVRSS
jgi:hypothetical protein